VAQIFGKPIYVINDIALLPIWSHESAEEAISQAHTHLQQAREAHGSGAASTASEESEDEDVGDHSAGDPPEPATLSSEGVPTVDQAGANSSVAQDVSQRKGQYGLYASQWFSSRGWSLTKKFPEVVASQMAPNLGYESIQKTQPQPDEASSRKSEDNVTSSEAERGQKMPYAAAIKMLSKIVRTTKLLFTSRSFYFSYDINITKRLSSSAAMLYSSDCGSPEDQVRLMYSCSQDFC
jgi:SacI homology domain